MKPVPVFLVLPESVQGRGMNRHQARLAKLALPNQQHPRLPIDVLAVQGQSLADAEACGREQAEQRGVRPVSEAFARGKLLGRLKQLPDLLIGVEVRGFSPAPIQKEVLRRAFGPRVAGLVMDGEIANDPKPPGRPGR
jgi:hypothetical protein